MFVYDKKRYVKYSGNFNVAEKYFNEVIVKNPKCADAYLGMGSGKIRWLN